MNSHRTLMILMSTALTVSACGKDRKEKNVAFGLEDIQGDWAHDCRKGAALQDNPFHVSRKLTIEGEKFTRTDSVWTFGACDELVYKTELTGSIAQGESAKGIYRLVAITVDSVKVTAYDKDIVTIFNNLKYCGRSGWAITEPVIVDEVCKTFSLDLNINGFQTSEGRLQFVEVSGKNVTLSGEDAYSRPLPQGS